MSTVKCALTTLEPLVLIPDPLVSVPNFSRMVAILVRRRVPILDNGGTGLMDLGSARGCTNSGQPRWSWA